MAALDCLTTLIGLSQTDYDCFTAQCLVDYDVSDSGYFLIDADYGLEIIGNLRNGGLGLARTGADGGHPRFQGRFFRDVFETSNLRRDAGVLA